MDVQAHSEEDPIGTGFVSASAGLPGASSQHSIWFGDINNDSNLDIATAGYSGVRVWTGDGAGNWSPASTGLPSTTFDAGVSLGDINNDGDLDLAASNYDYGPGTVGVWTGNGAGSWTPASTGLPGEVWNTGLFLADINNDDNLDLAVGNDVFGGVKVFTGNGAGVWTQASTNLPTSGSYFSVWMDDVNNDNNTDLAAAGAGLHVWLGDGTGIWTEASNGLPWTDQWNGVTMGDIDLDGNLDIVSSMDMGGHGIKAWLGDGTSNWTLASNGLPTNDLYYGVILADLVGDKYPDILAAGYGGNGIRIWKGDGGSTWTDASATLPVGKVIGVAAGDINDDGYMDIGAAGEGFGVQVWINDETSPPLKVEVEDPNAGEIWKVGTQHAINWTASGGTAPLTIRIEYSIDGITGQYSQIADGESNDGTFLWTVPNTPSSDCYVRVNVTDSALRTNWDKSNNSFTIPPVETTPPVISGLLPINQSVIGNAMPIIGANYSDVSGINTTSVLLMVDGIDGTPSAIVTDSNVTYIPALPLSDGIHDVYLEVRDDSINQNKAVVTWQFTVDTQPPDITNLLPNNGSTVGDDTPTISASYSDPSGIDTGSVMLKLDTVDVTASSTITPTGVMYTPVVPLPNGRHNVSLQVNDSSTPMNTAVKTWWFNVDTTIVDTIPPSITNMQPINESIIGDASPVIRADYADSSGIDITTVVLEVDSIDVTSLATITPLDIIYTPLVPLTEGLHDAYLEVQDDSANHNVASKTWWFLVDTTPPLITIQQPANESTILDSTPVIRTSYSDDSGINVTDVTIFVDLIDVTPLATVTPNYVSYMPASTLSEGRHDVRLEVGDQSAPQNRATVTWWFLVNPVAPEIMDMQPLNQSIISDNLPVIGANYSDESGIDTAGVILMIDGIDFTSSATVTSSQISYTPATPLTEGVHNAYLEVRDNSPMSIMSSATWWFIVDTLAPNITSLQPTNNSLTSDNTPTIRAGYEDASGVDLSSIVIEVDGIDVTGSAVITADQVTFTLSASLPDGSHNVRLTVEDISSPSNVNVTVWSFEIDSTPPTINHQAISSGTAGEDIPVEATITDSNGVSTASLFYKRSQAGSYIRIAMTPSASDTFTATIPGSDATTDGVWYYIEANDTLDNIGRRPDTDWEIDITERAEQPSGLPIIPILAAAIIIIIVVIALLLLMRKKKEQEPE
ncbi:MAG: VCBS repeat-containing protein [Methanobacteriota archaeon]|nr:MAG: VCBS repeat-containing protein [Euryarchaeota archaeon]